MVKYANTKAMIELEITAGSVTSENACATDDKTLPKHNTVI